MPVNPADKSVSVEGHYLPYQSAKASNTRGYGQRFVQSLRDTSLDLIKETKGNRSVKLKQHKFVTQVFRKMLTPEQTSRKQAVLMLSLPSASISKMPLSKAFNLQPLGSQQHTVVSVHLNSSKVY